MTAQRGDFEAADRSPVELLDTLDALRAKATDYAVIVTDEGAKAFEQARYELAHVAFPALVAALRAVLDKHVPWYEVNGVRHENLVTIGCDQHTCTGDNETPCLTAAEFGYHEVPGCAECRYVGEWDGDGSLLWPCPTVRAVTAALTEGGQAE